MNFCVNVTKNDYKEADIESDELLKSKYGNVILELNSNTNDKLYEYYTGLKSLLMNGNRVVLIVVKDSTNIDKQLINLCVSYGCYNIYYVINEDSITEEYINTLLNREPTLAEVELFVSKEAVAYNKIDDILAKMDSLTGEQNSDGMMNLVIENRSLIERFPSVFSYMRKSIDNNCLGLADKLIELEAEKKELEGTQIGIKEASINKDKRIEELQKEMEELREDIEESRKSSARMERELSKSGKITMYSPIKLNTIKTGVRSILYFKEITSVQYINTFVIMLHEYCNKVLKRNTKLVIYDSPGDFASIYTPIPVMDSGAFFTNHDKIRDEYPKVVLVETNPSFMSEILKGNSDILIIYDRLKKNNDIVEGNIVNKFTVIGSMSHILKIENQTGRQFDKTRLITNSGTLKESMSISTAMDFKKKTSQTKLMAYSKMLNVGEDARSLFEIVLSKSGIENTKN